LIDRTNCIRPPQFDGDDVRFDDSRLLKAKGAYILVGGEREKFDVAERVIGGMFAWCGIERIGRMIYAHSHASLGKVRAEPDILDQAFHLGADCASRLTLEGQAP
jgi:hypothetical protein